ncbi:fibronectin type III domain-containing protein [Mucilaginibacter humi]|uniref:fibronectin type III domain-containing protein n=1 Tax=Mucilaginibacter humi TaxID=2732510 RepID=UPI001FE3BB14|nr:fibronectin type III domain-containing protein [Mucilaginibacter humi]
MLWLDSIAPNTPRNLVVTRIPTTTSVQLRWEAPLPAKDNEPVYGYVIYRFEGEEKIDIAKPENILHIQYNATPFFMDTTALPGKTYLYVVTAIDRLKNESDRTPTMAAPVQ